MPERHWRTRVHRHHRRVFQVQLLIRRVGAHEPHFPPRPEQIRCCDAAVLLHLIAESIQRQRGRVLRHRFRHFHRQRRQHRRVFEDAAGTQGLVAQLHPGQARQALRERLLRGFLPSVAQGFLQERLHRAAVRPPRELQRHRALHLPRILLRLPLDQRQVFARRGQKRLVAPLTQVRIQRIRQLLVPPN